MVKRRSDASWLSRALAWLSGKQATPPAGDQRRSSLDEMRELAPERVRYFLSALATEVRQCQGVLSRASTMPEACDCAHSLKNACLNVGLFEDSDRAQRIYDAIKAGEATASHTAPLSKLADRALAMICSQPEMK